MSDTPGPERSSYRWVMLAALCLIYASHGMVVSAIAPLVGPISEDLGLSRTTMGSILGAWPVIYIFTAFPVGAAIDRFGLKRSLLAGISFIVLSQLLRAAAVNYVTLLLAVAAFGLGGPFVSVGAPKLVATWFSRQEIGGALGTYTIAPSLGRIVAVSTANAVVMPLVGHDWRLALLVYAGFPLMAAVLWFLLAREAPGRAEARATNGGHHGAFAPATAKQLLRVPAVQVILVMTLGTFLYSHAMNDWMPEVLRSSGMGPAEAGLWATVPTVAGIVAALTIPRFVPALRRLAVITGLFAIGFVAPFLVGFTRGPVRALGLGLLGVRLGAMTPMLLTVLMAAPMVTAENMGAAGGLYFTTGEVGGVLGPLLLGWLADMTGDFGGGLLALAGVSVLLMLLSLALRLLASSQSS